MQLTLHDALALAGRLDDTRGFDAPRERFRRFLLSSAIDATDARSFIDEIRESLTDQHHRALQDLIVSIGRFLGFECAFRASPHAAMSTKSDGWWKAPGLDVDVYARTDQSTGRGFEEIVQLLRERTGAHNAEPAHLALCVVSPLYATRAALDGSDAAESLHPDLRVMSIRSLLWMVEMVGVRRLKHQDVVRLFRSGISLDFGVDLMTQFATAKTSR
jgi:hypothetical protein